MPRRCSRWARPCRWQAGSDFYKAAAHSNFTPATPGWATVEADNVMETLFSQVAAGKQSIAKIAAATDKQLDNLLNARQ